MSESKMLGMLTVSYTGKPACGPIVFLLYGFILARYSCRWYWDGAFPLCWSLLSCIIPTLFAYFLAYIFYIFVYGSILCIAPPILHKMYTVSYLLLWVYHMYTNCCRVLLLYIRWSLIYVVLYVLLWVHLMYSNYCGVLLKKWLSEVKWYRIPTFPSKI